MEHDLAKVGVAGSSPVSRFLFYLECMRTGHEPARGFVSSFYFGRRRTDIHRMSCAPSRALLIYKRYPKRIPFVYKRVLPDSNGSYLRSTSVGANGSPMDFQHPVSRNEGLRRTRTFEVSALLRSVQDCVFLVL